MLVHSMPYTRQAQLSRVHGVRLLLPKVRRGGDAHLVSEPVPATARTSRGRDHARLRQSEGGAVHDQRTQGERSGGRTYATNRRPRLDQMTAVRPFG